MGRRLRVTGQAWLAEGVLELRMRATDESALPGWEPGAHLTLTLPNGLSRDYSLCGDPADDSTWTVAVGRERESRGGSAFIHEQLRVGDLIEVADPRNNFALRPAEDYLLVAGGIGITPIVAMAEQLAARGARWSLLYCGRSRAAMAFLPRLRGLGADRVVVHCDDEQGGPPDLDALLPARAAGTQVYCCGPEPMIAAVARRVPEPDALHVERFRAAPPVVPDEQDTFEVVCAGSGIRVPVPTGVSIVDALAAGGVEVATSCREGICGTCETKVLAGEPDHRDSVLTGAERATGQTMMLCVSRCRSAELLLDLP